MTDNGTTNGAPDPKSDTATVSFTITEVNDAPTSVNDTLASVAEDSGQRTIPFSTLTANDSKGPANESGQTLIVKTVSNPVGGTVSILGGNVLFTPTADYFGPASFHYTVEDNGTTNGVADPLTSGTATASFTITEVNDAPDAVTMRSVAWRKIQVCGRFQSPRCSATTKGAGASQREWADADLLAGRGERSRRDS